MAAGSTELKMGSRTTGDGRIINRVKAVVESTLRIPPEKLDVEAEFKSYGMDSVIAMEVITRLSDELNVTVNPAQIAAVRTVKELAEYIERNPPAPARELPSAAGAALNGHAWTLPAGLEPRVRSAGSRMRGAKVKNGRFDQLLDLIEANYSIRLPSANFETDDEIVDALIENHFDQLMRHYESAVPPGSGTTARAPGRQGSSTERTSPSLGDVAIIGISCTLPDAPDAQAFWRNLMQKKVSIRRLPESRWSPDSCCTQSIAASRPAPKWGALIENVECFDPDFFKLDPARAKWMDPQERLLLQEVYKAFQDSGLHIEKVSGSAVGVFVGYEYAEYEQYFRKHAREIPGAPPLGSSSPGYYLANRVSYAFDLRGPSESINVSCASSALAINNAYHSLRAGESDLAVACGVSLNLFEDDYIALSRLGFLSPTGTCAVFGDDANGYTRGEGVGAIVLKRLDEAEADGDRIYAVIKACHQNNRGHAESMSEIRHESISDVISDCYKAASVSPQSVRYIEVNGYATKWGDSFEFEGIKNVFRNVDYAGKTCALGSLKGNIGHLEPVNGLAGVIKVALSMRNEQFPPTVTTQNASSFIDFQSPSHPLYFADTGIPFDSIRDDTRSPIRAGVSSFADSGTNVHILLEEYGSCEPARESEASEGDHLFVLSAKNRQRLEDYIDSFIGFLGAAEVDVPFTNLIYTLQCGRDAMQERLGIVSSSCRDLLEKLRSVKAIGVPDEPGTAGPGIHFGHVEGGKENPLISLIEGDRISRLVDESRKTRDWHQVLLLWVNGISIPWERIWDGDSARFVSLPGYPFARERHWIDVIGKAAAPGDGNTEAAGEPSSRDPDGAAAEPGSQEEWQFSAAADGTEPHSSMTASEKAELFVRQEVARQLQKAVHEIPAHAHYLELGVTSLGITGITQNLNDLLQARLSPSVFVEYTNVRSFAAYLAETFPEKLDALIVSRISVRHGQMHESEATRATRSASCNGVLPHPRANGASPARQAGANPPQPMEFPLTAGEKALYILQTIDPEMSAFNVPLCFDIGIEVNTGALERAWALVLDRYPILTARIVDKDETLYHCLDDKCRTTVRQHSLDIADDRELVEYLRGQVKQPFDLKNGPLTRVDLYRRPGRGTIFLLTTHHLVFDGTSAAILLRLLFSSYRKLCNGEQPPASSGEPLGYHEFVAWEDAMLKSAEGRSHAQYWQEQLRGDLPVFELFPDLPRLPSSSYTGRTLITDLSAELSRWLHEFSRAKSLQPSVLFLALFQFLLHKYSSHDDIVIGMPVLRRVGQKFKDDIGYFTNMVPLRVRFDGRLKLTEFLRQVQGIMLDGLYHSDYPFATIVENLNAATMRKDPVFQVAYAYQDFVQQADLASLPGMGIEPVPGVYQEGDFDLALEVFDKPTGFFLHLKYNPELYAHDVAERLLGHFCTLLERVSRNQELRLDQYPLGSEHETRHVVAQSNQTRADYARDKCLHQIFAEQAAIHPERTAVVCEAESLSYRQLYEKSYALGMYLQALGVEPDNLVGLCVERSLSMMVGILGILQSGGAYVPLDPDYPDERLAYMLEDSQAGIVLTQGKFMSKLSALAAKDVQLVALDERWPEVCKCAAHLEDRGFSLRQDVKPHHVAYVIYTSGSTGKPKGVMVQHNSVVNHNRYTGEKYQVTKDDVQLQFASMNFDAFVEEVFVALSNGAQLVLEQQQNLLSPREFEEIVRRRNITILNLPTAYFHHLMTESVALAGVKCLIVGGEKLLHSKAKEFVERYPDIALHNTYGPTEATIICTAVTVTKDLIDGCDEVPIGVPIANTQIYILDRYRHPVPVGVPGELHIAGDGLARGYLNRRELTEEKFVANPFNPGTRMYRTGDLARWLEDGNIEYLGRIDTQVKVRGFRIETGEIEAWLNRHPKIRESVVIARGEGADKQLVAFYVAEETREGAVADLAPDGLRTHLQRVLPDYMVPAVFASLESIPLTPNGKVDRRALARLDVSLASSRAYVPPRNDMERQLVEIWAEILNVEPGKIGINDNFFDLGGHSLLATRLISRIRTGLETDLPMKALFSATTVSGIAEVVAAFKAHDEQSVGRDSDDAEFEEISL